jgi:hypothetical protein
MNPFSRRHLLTKAAIAVPLAVAAPRVFGANMPRNERFEAELAHPPICHIATDPLPPGAPLKHLKTLDSHIR